MMNPMPKYDANIQRAAIINVMKEKKLSLNYWCKAAGLRESGVRGFLKDKSPDKTLNVKTIVNLADAANIPLNVLIPFSVKTQHPDSSLDIALYSIAVDATMSILKGSGTQIDTYFRLLPKAYKIAIEEAGGGQFPKASDVVARYYNEEEHVPQTGSAFKDNKAIGE